MAFARADQRQNLVIVRAGPDSLHERWLRDAEFRSWDLLVSSYDSAATFVKGPGVSLAFHAGGKWDGLYQVLSESDLLDCYYYIWLPDDDIEATARDIDSIFSLMREYDFCVGQPSLTHDSYYSHFITNSCRRFAVRYTNFVESMAPCFETSHLRSIVREFAGTMSGYGLDYIWCRTGDAAPGRAGIFDRVAVKHTRPIGHTLRSEMAKRGLLPEAEEAALKQRYGIRGRPVPLVYAAVDAGGRSIRGRRRLGFAMAARYLSDLPEFADRRLAARKIVQLVRRQLTKPLDLSKLAAAPDTSARKPASRARSQRPLPWLSG